MPLTDLMSLMKHLAEYFSNAREGHNFSYSYLTLLILSWEGTAPLAALWDHSNNLRMIYITLKEKDIKTCYSHAEIFSEISSCQNTKQKSGYSWVMERTAKLYGIIRLHLMIGWCFHLTCNLFYSILIRFNGWCIWFKALIQM